MRCLPFTILHTLYKTAENIANVQFHTSKLFTHDFASTFIFLQKQVIPYTKHSNHTMDPTQNDKLVTLLYPFITPHINKGR